MAGKSLQRWVPTRTYARIRPHLPDWSFITIHYAYFIGTCMLSSIIIWGASTPPRSLSYTDSLFLAVSAMTLAGLNTVNLSTLNTFQQFMLFLLIMLGSAILVSSVVVHVRKSAFERKLQSIVEQKESRRHRLQRVMSFPLSMSRSKRRKSNASTDGGVDGVVVRGRPIKEYEDYQQHVGGSAVFSDGSPAPNRTAENHLSPSHEGPDLERGVMIHSNGSTRNDAKEDDEDHVRFGELPAAQASPQRRPTRIFSGAGVGAFDLDRHPRNVSRSSENTRTIRDEKPSVDTLNKLDKYLNTVNGLIGRNSQIHNLTLQEREELGGLEYQAVSYLSVVVPLYFVLWQLLGALGCGAWIQNVRPESATKNGLKPFWVGAFFAVSAFNNSGMALLDANMTAYQTSYYMLLTLSLLILAGNTCFPPFLRLIVWTMRKCLPDTPKMQEKRKVLAFILEHPRRVYTNMFPARETWYLVLSLVILNGLDWFAFGVLDIHNKAIETVPVRFRVVDGLFQAFAIRAGGFYVFPIPDLRPGLLVLYVFMMYISAYPVTMTMRTTNTYEERSLGLYAEDVHNDGEPEKETGKTGGVFGKIKNGMTRSNSSAHFLRQQLHGQLAHDLWWLALAVLFITIVETGQFERDPVVFSVFNILFEVVSAYGCVGVSTGVPNNAYSFCGAWHTLSKLILCAVMLRGRHRGLPVAIDKAILLPDKTLAWAEEEDAALRLERARTRQRTGLKNA